MPSSDDWRDVGAADELASQPLRQLLAGNTPIALVYRDGQFSAISGRCNHVGGPLGDGRIDGEYVVCPWHNWRFHCRTGQGEPGYEDDAVPVYDVRVEQGRVLVNLSAKTQRTRHPHPPHPLTKLTVRGGPGGPALDAPLRLVGISTTNMDTANPRYSTSDDLLNTALAHAETKGVETRLIRLAELIFRACEGYYSKSAHACTWPCSITQMDPDDQMDRVYEAIVQWADIFLIATPIRWGQASSLYYKMVERMNCVQNQETIADRIMLRNRVAGFIVTGGQDNVQGVVGQLMTFFGELGCQFPQFPFIAHSRGWSAEDMENNMRAVQESAALHDGARGLVDRCADTCRALLGVRIGAEKPVRGGRKAHRTA
ncbi:MAG: NAD(P)H-dependent oxidoreductase [Phycisphaerales bacterium]|nr:NAD(P)H-dependent oxidoreductase [Phycisphaerales bacterium]